VIFVAEKVTSQHVFLPIPQFYLVSYNPPLLHTHLEMALPRKTNGRSLGTFQKAVLFLTSVRGKDGAVKVLSL